MNVKFQGFELGITSRRISWDQFLNDLTTYHGVEVPYTMFNRILCLDNSSDSNYLLGLFVSVKNQKRFCAIKESGGLFELVAEDLEDGSRMADFNFFILNKSNFKGIYQYYHQSCSLQQFLGFWETRFIKYRKKLIERIRETSNDGDGQLLNQIDQLKKCSLSTQVIVRNETFNQLLNQFDEIKEMQFSISAYDANSSWFTPLRDAAKKRTERVLFNRNMLSSAKRGIRRFIRQDEIDDVRVKGISSHTGLLTTIRLLNNLDDFGYYDYDDLTEHLAVELDNFERSQIIDLLRTAADNNAHIFEGQ